METTNLKDGSTTLINVLTGQSVQQTTPLDHMPKCLTMEYLTAHLRVEKRLGRTFPMRFGHRVEEPDMKRIWDAYDYLKEHPELWENSGH